MKWLKALLGLAVIGTVLYLGIYLSRNKVDVPFIPELAKPIPVKDGMEVPLVLLTPLDSGGTEEGKSVTFVVAEDVKGSNGGVVIKQGSLATGKVVQSRAGSILGAITNQPARLEVELNDVTTVNGKSLKIRGSEPGKPFSFDQANTKPEEKPNAVDAITDPKARDFVASMARQIVTGHEMAGDDKKEADDDLKDLASRYGLESTSAFLNQPSKSQEKKNDVAGLLEAVQKGDTKGLTGVDLLLAAKAAGEIVQLGSGIDKSLRGIFKGNNIHAKVGTPVTAYIAETKSVR